MLKRELVQTVEIPGSQARMSLFKQGVEFSIWVDGVPLMTSRKHGSEEALAALGCAHLANHPDGRILVGGLGMGFTLSEALRIVDDEAKVKVAELVPAVRDWNRDLLGGFANHPLKDPRVEVEIADVADVLRSNPDTFDAILLDVDNGPSGMTQDKNTWLYWPEGIAVVSKALRPGGVVAVWSAYSDPAFHKRLVQQRFRVSEHQVGARGKSGGSKHFIWVAEKSKR